MPNPTTSQSDPIDGHCRLECAVAATASEVHWLNPDQQFEVRHMNVDEAGGADVNTIHFTTDGDAPVVSFAAGRHRLAVRATETTPPTIGPGVRKLRFISAGIPVFELAPSGLYRGNVQTVDESE